MRPSSSSDKKHRNMFNGRLNLMNGGNKESVAILAQAISCSNVRCVFPVHERFWFCLVQVGTTQFCSFPSFLMARASDGTDVPVSPVAASSSNMGSPNGSLPDFEGTGYRASTMEEKINEMFVQIAKLPLLMQSVSRFGNCVQTLSQTALQPVVPHWKRMQRPSPVDPTRQDLGIYSDIEK